MSLAQHAAACLSKQASFAGLNAFISQVDSGLVTAAARLADQRVQSDATLSPIDGRLIAAKDNICTLEGDTTCASNILRNYRSPYAATVVAKLQASGAIVCGKTNLDEFGMGSHSTHSAYGPVWNPIKYGTDQLSAGGSSGGSAVAVASGQCWAALGTDTGGSVRLPASYCGLVGFKPSYGRLSRYGVVAYANSLDTVGILARSSSDAKSVYQQLDGFDPYDPTSLSNSSRSRISELLASRKQRDKLRIGVPRESNMLELDEKVQATWLATLQALADAGHVVVPTSLPSTRLALAAYYILAPAEASSNLAKYDGVRYGEQPSSLPTSSSTDNVLYARTRGAGLGTEVQRRILLGAYSLSASAMDNYFMQAQRVRRLVCEDFDRAFALPNGLQDRDQSGIEDGTAQEQIHETSSKESGVDVLLTPTAPSLPPTLDQVAAQSALDTYRGDVLTVPASLAGLPAISVPAPARLQDWGDARSVGLQIIGQFGDDEIVLRAAGLVETLASD